MFFSVSPIYLKMIWRRSIRITLPDRLALARGRAGDTACRPRTWHRALELGDALAAFGHTNPPASYPAWRSLAALEHHALGNAEEALALGQEEVAKPAAELACGPV